ncbi:hypothetical protein [Halorussus sp. MSC15.2]|uniref:hypothetical protein n=1 Tax=Halorussus sp. MSC15.2 TaxID=2283638 RepID=UPI0013D44340|nr:hypothetical protein [Halorussus sp. MSC15.2]NEU59203.1 hypothetical protein [Halorussus sp. MSC15.2]
MQDWEIQFYSPTIPNCRFIHRFLYALVVQGVRYNTGKYPGKYRIIPINPNEEIAQKASGEQEYTERLADIVNLYTDFDPSTTEMGIDLTYMQTTNPIHFNLGLVPTDESGCRIQLSVVGTEVQTDDRFQSFVDLCAGVFQRVDLPYGSFRGEYDNWLPTTTEAFLQERLRRVTFLSAELVDEIGRRKILSAPTERTVEFADEGVVLVTTSGPLQDGGRTQELNEYLGLQD